MGKPHKRSLKLPISVTPPRSEGSDSPGTEILRCAQDDMIGWIVSVALDMK